MIGCSMDHSYTWLELSIEALMEDIESLSTRRVLESRDGSLINIFWTFRIMKIPIQGSKSRFCYQILLQYLLDTSIKDIKPVVTEKHQFEQKDNAKLRALLGSYAQSGF